MPSLERSPALPQPHPGSWLVNAWQKPEDSFTRTQMYPLLCHPHLILLIILMQSVYARTGCYCSPRLECRPEITAGLLLSFHSRKPYCSLVSVCSPDPSLRHEVSDVLLPSYSSTFWGCPIGRLGWLFGLCKTAFLPGKTEVSLHILSVYVTFAQHISLWMHQERDDLL
jgi:hypothetical protein